MALIDSKCLLSEDAALPSSSSTFYTTNEIHFESGKDAFGTAITSGPGIGMGTPLFANFVVTANSSSSGAGSVAVNLVHGSATAPTTKLLELATGLTSATLVAGYKLSVSLPAAPAVNAYLRGQLIATTAGFEAGSYEMWISEAPVASI